MKKHVLGFVFFSFLFLTFQGCATNPYTGQKTMAFHDREELNTEASLFYGQFLGEVKDLIITGTPEAEMVQEVGENLRQAAELWAASKDSADYLNDYQWEYTLIEYDEANAWCAAGGKICVYTGILPFTQDKHGLAFILGHELSHALLNHTQQRKSAADLQKAADTALSVGLAVATNQTDDASVANFAGFSNMATTFLGVLPFSRKHETEADKIGLTLMLIAGYDGNEAVKVWERFLSAMGSSGFEFLSTHPSHEHRIRNIQDSMGEAWKTVEQVLAWRLINYGL